MEVEPSQQNTSSSNTNTQSNNNKKPNSKRGPPRKRRIFRNSLGRRRGGNDNRRSNNYPSNRGRISRNFRPMRRPLSANSRNNRNDTRTRLFIRNLNKNVTNADLKNIFQKIGPLKRCGIHYRAIGDSKGTADVQYIYREDAYRAARQLNYKTIKGIPIRIEINGREIGVGGGNQQRSNSAPLRRRNNLNGPRRFGMFRERGRGGSDGFRKGRRGGLSNRNERGRRRRVGYVTNGDRRNGRNQNRNNSQRGGYRRYNN